MTAADRPAEAEGVADHGEDGTDDGEDEQSHRRAAYLAGQRRARLAQEGADGLDGLVAAPGLETARTSLLPMITPSAISPTAAACSGVPMPKPTATGTRRLVANRGDELGQMRRQLVALAGDPGVGDEVDEALGALAQGPPALGRGGGRDQRHERDPASPTAPRRPRRPPPGEGRA